MTDQRPDINKLYAEAVKCPDGFTAVLEQDGLFWFICDSYLKELPPEMRAKMRIIKPH